MTGKCTESLSKGSHGDNSAAMDSFPDKPQQTPRLRQCQCVKTQVHRPQLQATVQSRNYSPSTLVSQFTTLSGSDTVHSNGSRVEFCKMDG